MKLSEERTGGPRKIDIDADVVAISSCSLDELFARGDVARVAQFLLEVGQVLRYGDGYGQLLQSSWKGGRRDDAHLGFGRHSRG